MANKRLMLDTSILIDYFRSTDKINTRLVQLSEQYTDLFISTITEYEIFNGATTEQLNFWNDVLASFTVLSFDSSAARAAAKLRNKLKKQGRTIETADLFIASVAISNNLILDTFNRKHFLVIDSLTLL